MANISIAMATYNGERYIREQLDSILAQTVPFNEMIICDDVSSDNTWDILCEYAAKDARIKIFRNEQNLGFLKNFERALTLCAGDYIALSDQDDIWLPEHLEILLNGIGDKLLAVGDAEIINANGEKTGLTLSYCTNLDYVPNDDLSKAYFIFFYQNQYHGMTMLMKKSFLSLALPIPCNMQYHDVWFGSLSCFYGGMAHMFTTVSLYRRIDTSISGPKVRKTRIRTMIGHMLFSRALTNRPALISALRERVGGLLTSEQLYFLDTADRYHKRRKNIFGRITNFFFELKHFKLIYGCK